MINNGMASLAQGAATTANNLGTTMGTGLMAANTMRNAGLNAQQTAISNFQAGLNNGAMVPAGQVVPGAPNPQGGALAPAAPAVDAEGGVAGQGASAEAALNSAEKADVDAQDKADKDVAVTASSDAAAASAAADAAAAAARDKDVAASAASLSKAFNGIPITTVDPASLDVDTSVAVDSAAAPAA